MAIGPPSGRLSYNGYVFDGATSVNVSTSFVYDEAQRSVIAEKYLITVRAIVTDSVSLDSDLEDIRARLSKPGKQFQFTDRGFGDDLIVNGGAVDVPGGVRDVLGGPRPKMLSWLPIGDVRAAEIEWQIEVAIGSCDPDKQARSTGVMAINYAIEFAINSEGDTTRTIRGYIQIVNRRGELFATDTADRYREKFNAPLLQGFKRSQNWSVNQDKSRIEFAIIDEQIPSPNAYPRGVTSIQASHRMSFDRGRRSGRFQNTISATISPRAGLSGAQAWASFATLVGSRLNFAKRKGNELWIKSIDIEESIFARVNTFSVTYAMLNTIDELIGDTGLWQAVGTTWGRWAGSMANVMQDPRGHGQLQDIAANDVVINLCSPTDTVYINNRQNVIPTRAPVVSAKTKGTFQNAKPKAAQSFSQYKHAIRPRIKRTTTKHRIIQDPGSDGGFWNPETTATAPSVFSTGAIPENREPDRIQEDTAPCHTFEYIGFAERVGYPVPRVKIEKVGSQDAKEVESDFIQVNVGKILGVDVFQAAWRLGYELTHSPGVVDIPKTRSSKTGQ